MIRIGIDIRPLLEKTWSGIPQYTYYLLQNIFKIDDLNQYYLLYNSYNTKLNLAPLINKNVTVVDYHYPNRLLNASIVFLKQPSIERLIYNRINQMVDIVFYPNLNFLAINSSKKHTKSIITIHDLSFEINPEFYSKKDRLWRYIINAKKLCQQANKIISVSEHTKKDLMRLYKIEENKIKVIYSGLNEIKAPAQQKRPLFNLPSNYILCLGTIEKRKNLSNLIKAFHIFRSLRKNKQIKLVMAGSMGYGGSEIINLIPTLKLQYDIIYLGSITEEAKQELYKNASLFIFPSVYEGFGMPVLEAMQFNIPVIASYASSLGEICSDSALLIDPDDVNTMAHSIIQVLEDVELKNQLIANAQKRIKKFSWQKAAQETVKLFNEL